MGHWHAYSYTGHERPPDSEMSQVDSPCPPIEVAHWLRKPASRIVGTHTGRDTALDWLEAQLEDLPPVPHDLPVKTRLSYAEEFLGRGADVVWGYYTVTQRYAARAMIACPRAGENCPAPPR